MGSVAARVGKGFSERLSDFAETVQYRRIESEADREAVFRLRYEAYVREGTIPISFEKRFADKYDELPNVWIFGAYIDGELASSLRVHVATPEHPLSPSVDVFPDVLRPEIEKGRTIVDPTRFVAHPAIARHYPELPYITVRLGFLASEYFRADLGLASVRVEHQAFYKRVFLMNPLCEPRRFPKLAPLFSLMGVNYPSVKERIIQRYPFMQSTPAELEELYQRGDRNLADVIPLELRVPAEAHIVGKRPDLNNPLAGAVRRRRDAVLHRRRDIGSRLPERAKAAN